MNALQQKYKDNPEEYQRRVMELYKEHKVNPLSGCLPMLIHLPFLWALFSVLRNFDFGTGFLWLTSLSEPDPYYILPVASALTTYTQMIMTSADASQKSMMLIMPIFIGYISISFPAGLVLYWVVSNLFSMGQQYLIARRMNPQEGGKA
jgi:YidC/Oxa1 family membrane protein insertase